MMADMESDPKAKEIFAQEIFKDDLDAVVGGESKGTMDCINSHYRDIYAGGFANCAATVEDGSHCDLNDACYDTAVVYTHMDKCSISDCRKAWR